MKIGDNIYCFDNCKLNFYSDDINYHNNDLLKINKNYTIHKIFVEYNIFSSEYVKEVNDINNNQVFFELSEIEGLCFNRVRFLSEQEYRKLKLQKIQKIK